ncbi:MAG: glycoside hydrolase family 3 C-terminal domain-containing protein [Bacteroidaceae bacterium]|nr:glycoside hydrolase family 3 C-terminal domain-containing protein [Bacteroidaceae bacterium]
MKHCLSAVSLLLILTTLSCTNHTEVYKDANAPIEERVNDLVSRMTIDEKIGQLLCPLGWPMYEKSADGVQPSELFRKRMDEAPIGGFWAVLRADPWTQKTLETGLNPEQSALALNALQRYAVEHTRLGIPILFAEETPHGHMAIGTTVFPTALGQASTFDADLMRRMGEAMGREVRLQGAHVGYGPVVDIAREPRWSRMEETFGEDPVLTGILATAIVKGMQGDSIADGEHVFSTLKHFAAYGIPQGGLNGEHAVVGRRALFSEYIPQFKRIIREAHVGSIMTSYNTIDGEPCTGSHFLLTEVLRKQWGFDGAIYSDLQSIEVMNTRHHVAKDWEEAGSISLKAGVDIDLEGNSFSLLKGALAKGLVTEADIDRAVRNVLRLKFRLGLFENPYVSPEKARAIVGCAEHKALAREVAAKSVVLLKNDGLLPLAHSIKSIAVIGPNADEMYNQLGDYTAPQARESIATVLDGIRAKLPGAKVNFVKGCAIRDVSKTDISAAVSAAKASEVTVLVVGGSSARDFKTEYLSTGAAIASDDAISDMECGEGYDRADLHLLGDQERLMRALVDAGVKLVVVYIGGRPYDMSLANERANALCTAWYPGGEGGNGIADILFGDCNPAGRLPVSVPRSVGQLPVHYSKRPSHNYVDCPEEPLFAFGYGLSYTRFEYSDLQLEPGDGKDIYQRVSFTVKNVGETDGDEVPQLYINDEYSSVETPHKLLKAFTRIHLKRGESRRLTFDLRFDDLSLYNIDMKEVVEPGTFIVMVGAASNDIRLEGKFEVN